MCNGVFIIQKKYPTQFCRGCNDTEYCTFCFHVAHPDKNCEEVKKGKVAARDTNHVLQEAASEAVIRRCPRCKSRFVKQDGCNRMTCATSGCGTLSCYLCKDEIAGYEHFCKNMERKSPSQPCPDPGCDKQCNLWTAADVMEEIEKEWALKAGRIALEKHGVNDPKTIEDLLSGLDIHA